MNTVMVPVAFLIAWLIPLLGPISVLWGLREARIPQP